MEERERGNEAEWDSANWREGPRATNQWTAPRSSLFIIGAGALPLTALSALMPTEALRSPHVQRRPRLVRWRGARHKENHGGISLAPHKHPLSLPAALHCNDFGPERHGDEAGKVRLPRSGGGVKK